MESGKSSGGHGGCQKGMKVSIKRRLRKPQANVTLTVLWGLSYSLGYAI